MTYTKRARFSDNKGQIFKVDEVIQGPAGLTVYYFNESTQQKYSCLLEAFAERFQEIPDDR
jgi:hypothetical protein